MLKFDWTLEELQTLYALPLFELLSRAHCLHIQYHRVGEIQVCSLISVKTGGCPEDCKYCAQSSRNRTSISAQPMMSYEEVMAAAKKAKERGATRICLGAAWREVRDNKHFASILEMIKGIRALGVEVCCTLGMLTLSQAAQLKEAGLYAYNHNLDTSERHYPNITTTRTYQERLNTIDIVRQANLSVCCGGILGLGEEPLDRLQLLLVLSRHNPHPESVPINRLSRIPGTPFQDYPKLTIWEMIRVIAVARLIMPMAMIRLSAGRIEMSYEEQTLCFLAGANSIHAGEKLLTVPNTPVDKDQTLFDLLGLTKRPAYAP